MKKIFIAVLFVISCFCIMINISTKAYAFYNSENYSFSGNECHLYLEHDNYLVSDKIDLTIYTSFINEVDDFIIEEEGFNLDDNIQFVENKIEFSVYYDETYSNPYFKLTIVFKNGETNYVQLFGYIYQNKVYLNPYSYQEAIEVYNYYDKLNKTNELQGEVIETDIINNMSGDSTSLLSITDNPDTYVNGIFKWIDDNGNPHPLQFCKIQLWDKEPINDKMLLETYTDKDGRYSFSFENADGVLQFENGGYDIYVKVLPAGSDITVLRGNGSEYYVDLGYYENIPTGSIEPISETFEMTDSDGNANMFSRALQVSQAAIFASKYYEEMKGSDVENVTIMYPHNEKSSGCFYRNNNKTIYITGSAPDHGMPESYASWDVIMHEYGHHVSNMEGITDSPGGGHYINYPIAEHYKNHFEGTEKLLCDMKCALYGDLNEFSESECKYKGMALAWSDGYATFFGTIAQEYYSNNLTGIDLTNDKSYTSYNGVDYSVENILGGTEDNESVVQGVLYDIYDVSSESYDTLTIDHKQIWDYIINSGAKTYSEFNNYFSEQIRGSNKLLKYNKILSENNLSPSSIISLDTLTTECPTFMWSWTEHTHADFYTNRTFKLNFYDAFYDLIGSTAIQSLTSYSITLDETLWTDVLNSTSVIYVSVTIYENNTPVTSYESELCQFYVSIPSTLTYTSVITRTLEENKCFWFKFVAPQDSEYIFETSGTTDTYGELFSKVVAGHSQEDRIIYNDDGSSQGNNFKIVYTLEKGDIIYLRVRGWNWTRTGEFTLTVSSTEHVHQYDYNYVYKDELQHNSYCCCGQIVSEPHNWYWDRTGNRCSDCGYFTTGPVIVTKPMSENNINLINEVPYLKEEDSLQ